MTLTSAGGRRRLRSGRRRCARCSTRTARTTLDQRAHGQLPVNDGTASSQHGTSTVERDGGERRADADDRLDAGLHGERRGLGGGDQRRRSRLRISTTRRWPRRRCRSPATSPASEDVLSFTNVPATMGNIAGAYNAGTGVMTLTSAGSTATLAQWQAALRAVQYSNSSDNPSTIGPHGELHGQRRHGELEHGHLDGERDGGERRAGVSDGLDARLHGERRRRCAVAITRRSRSPTSTTRR